MGTNTDKIHYFLMGSGAAIIYDPVKNVVEAQAINGVFAVAKKDAVELLRERGYAETTVEQLNDLGFAVPKVPDRVDYTVRDDNRYTFLE
jgi:hypothetical protein